MGIYDRKKVTVRKKRQTQHLEGRTTNRDGEEGEITEMKMRGNHQRHSPVNPYSLPSIT